MEILQRINEAAAYISALTPNINFLANLIYSANSSCVDTVICNGKIVMENRVVSGEREIIDNVNRLYKKLL
jgi:5-methylthioadenosine/S-adenosylhomocysteine deaminase